MRATYGTGIRHRIPGSPSPPNPENSNDTEKPRDQPYGYDGAIHLGMLPKGVAGGTKKADQPSHPHKG